MFIGDEEKGHPVNTGRIFPFILIMTYQWTLEGRREALVAFFFTSTWRGGEEGLLFSDIDRT